MSLYHEHKCDILKELLLFNISYSSAAVVDLSPFVNEKDVLHCNIFEEFTDYQYKKVSYNLKDHKRIYLIVDKFLKDSLKRKIRDEKRISSPCLFDGSTKLPVKFRLGFLKNSENKDELG